MSFASDWKRCQMIQTVTQLLTTSAPSRHAASQTFHLVEAAVEDPLHWIRVERHPLDLAALIFVVEGHGFTGGCADGQKKRCYTQTCRFRCLQDFRHEAGVSSV